MGVDAAGTAAGAAGAAAFGADGPRGQRRRSTGQRAWLRGGDGWSAGDDDGNGGGEEELAALFAPFFFPEPLSSDVIVYGT